MDSSVIVSHWAVLRTYLQRPLFQGLLLACTIPVLVNAIDFVLSRNDMRPPDALYVVADLFEYSAWICLPIVFGVASMAHLREQLSGHQRLLAPVYIRPHLRVATLVMVAMIFGVPASWLASDIIGHRGWVLFWPPFGEAYAMRPWGQYAGAALVSAVLLAVSAASATFGSPWASLLLAPIAIVAILSSGYDLWQPYQSVLERGLFLAKGSLRVPAWYWAHVVATVDLPLLIAAIARAILLRRVSGLVAVRRDGRRAWSVSQRVGVVTRLPPLATLWPRIRHRRSPVLSGFAPWLVGALVAVVLTVVPPVAPDYRYRSFQMQSALIFVTILPAVAVGCIWAERWPRVAVESLLPATRRQFTFEMAAAIGVDLASFWMAIAVGVSIPLLLFPAVPADPSTLAVRLAASATVQLLAFGALLWAMVLRSWPAMASLLGIALAGMAGPMLMSSKRVPLVPIGTLVETSAIVASVGLVSAGIAYRRWASADLA